MAEFPSTLSKLAYCAFYGCEGVTALPGGFPEGLEKIGDDCFTGCSLGEAEIFRVKALNDRNVEGVQGQDIQLINI